MIPASLTYIFASISVVLAGYGELRRTSIGYDNILEFQRSDGTWGTVCTRGFDHHAAKASCKQLGYSGSAYYGTTYYTSYTYNSPVICETYCYGYEDELADCDLTLCSGDYNYDYDYACSYIITLNCYNPTDYDNDYYDDGSTSGSTGATVGGVIGGILIAVLFIFLISFRLCLRRAMFPRNNNYTVAVTQQQTPRVLITRVTRTVSSGPAAPPTYTSSTTNPSYAPVPPNSHQPDTSYVAANPTNNSSDNIPSYPPPAYSYSCCTNYNAPIPVPPDSTQ